MLSRDFESIFCKLSLLFNIEHVPPKSLKYPILGLLSLPKSHDILLNSNKYSIGYRASRVNCLKPNNLAIYKHLALLYPFLEVVGLFFPPPLRGPRS